MHLERILGAALLLVACDRGETASPAEPTQPVAQAQPAAVAAPVATDRDSDGVVDTADPCPDQPGAGGEACPPSDLDKDGLLDRDDRCPDAPETINNVEDTDGCPDEIPPELTALNGPVLEIEFEMNKGVLKPKSFPALDRIVALLSKYPEMRIELSGHIDSKLADSDVARRVRLSGKRADAVRRYLIDKGIAQDRLVSRDAFDDEPIGDSKTEAGRSLNRRVRIKLLTP